MELHRSPSNLWAYAALALMTAMVSTGANANVITMNGYNGGANTISCLEGCSGFVGSYPGGVISLSLTEADEYPKANNPTNELARLNELLALFSPARSSVSYVNKTDGDGNGFTTSLQYFSIKKAQDVFFFENTSGGALTVALDGATEDYSHWTEYGPAVSQVPVPAAFWLFGTALIGFIGVSRRRAVA